VLMRAIWAESPMYCNPPNTRYFPLDCSGIRRRCRSVPTAFDIKAGKSDTYLAFIGKRVIR